MKTGLSYLPLGVGDAFTALHYTCCVAVQAEGQWIMIDCPHPIRKMLREGSESAGLSLDIPDISAVILTHLHADHSSGLEGHAFYDHFVLKKRSKLVCHPDVSKRLWDDHLAASMDTFGLAELGEPAELRSLDDYFELLSVTENEPVEVGPFTIEVRKTIHPIPTTAVKIRAQGRTLGHSSDTYFDASLIEWFADADVVIHETNYGIHTPYEMLAELPEEVRARMRLIHYPDGFDKAASTIEPLEQGRLYEV